MYIKLIRNDIRKSKLISAAIMAFIFISAMLVSLAAILTINLFGAIDNMLTLSKSPHFTHMHYGSINLPQVEAFVEKNPNIESWQVREYLNMESSYIMIGNENLSWSTQENGFSTQSDEFDFLLDMEGNVIHPIDGEIYCPLYYMKVGSIKLGDTISIKGIEFTVAGFVRDSMMNTAMASSKRFLVSEDDFMKLREHGIVEYLVEFRLIDQSLTASLEASYMKEDMPANGPLAITYPLLRMMNGVEDGMMIAILILISVLVIIVAFLCIRYTLLAKIEEDYREIGVLKAVGLRVSDLKRLYIAKYGALSAIACLLGFLLSLVVQRPFMTNIHLYLGVSDREMFGILAGLVGATVIYLIVMLYVSGVLKRFRKISAAQAIRFGAPEEKSKKTKGIRLSNGKFSPNTFLAIKDVVVRMKLYFTVFLVVVISSFIMLVPQNISSTISDPSFFTNMGIGSADFSLYLTNVQTEDVLGRISEIEDHISQDDSIDKYAKLIARLYHVILEDGSEKIMQVTLGDHTKFPINYDEGTEPRAENEIAISRMYANDFEKSVGDKLVLMVDGEKKHLTVCGIYSDITSNGKTSKAIFHSEQGDILNSNVIVAMADPSETKAKTTYYKALFPEARVLELTEMADQSFGTIASAIQMASYASIVIASLLIILVTLLFFKMLVAKDRYPIAILKSVGFTEKDIRCQYILRFAVVFVVAVIVGTLLANTLGEYVGVALIVSFGVSTFNFVINPWFAYLFSPCILAFCMYISVLFGASGIRQVKIFEHIKEA